MKNTLIALLVAVAFFTASCSNDGAAKRVVLTGETDSLSYSAGMFVAQGLRAMACDDMGIDSATMVNFVAGLRAAFPVKTTPQAKAFAYGMSLGASAMDKFEQTKEQFASQGVEGLDARLFLEGVVAAIYGDEATVDMRVAVEYYNQKRYRDESDEFMRRNGERRGVVTLSDGLQYRLAKKGSGAVAAEEDTVACRYKGYFTDGRVFDTSGDEVVEIPVAEAIQGFSRALTLFPEGTECIIYVPWQLGYGPRGVEGIPPYKALVFELEIVKVLKK